MLLYIAAIHLYNSKKKKKYTERVKASVDYYQNTKGAYNIKQTVGRYEFITIVLNYSNKQE